MRSPGVRDAPLRFAAALAVVGSLLCPRSGAGQAIKPDLTPSTALGTTVGNAGDVYTITGGTVRGNNLFHSFTDFNVPTLGAANFNGPASTANVLSRVTGGQPSSIDGVISTRAGSSPMPNANFYLINPSGVMYGPNASIDVGGTFHASTSDHIRLSDGAIFSVTGAGDTLLSSAPPQAFGFLNTNPDITSDGTLGTVVDGAGGFYTISGGTYRSDNLFHSFAAFSVPSFGAAIFDGLPATRNVISRVTGRDASSIDGLISTRDGVSPMFGANFFFINPAGIMFGPGASLNIGGSVHFSTADQVIFPDALFSAIPAPNELTLLSSAAPQAFGFLAEHPQAIDINNSVLFVDPDPGDGSGPRTLSLVGGNVTVQGPNTVLFAPGGIIQLVSVDSPGYVNLSNPSLESFSRLGVVRISDGPIITAGGSDFGFPAPGGTVVIRSGQLVVETGASVLSDTSTFGAQALGVDVNARDSVLLDTGALIQTQTSGSDNAPGIAISTRNLTMTGDAVIQSRAIFATETGNSGAIDVHVNSATLAGGTIQTASAGTAAGNVTLVATGSVTLSGPTTEISSRTRAGVVAGDVAVSAADIFLTNQAKISSGTVDQQGGKKLAVKAENTLGISGLASITSQVFSGEAGAIEISASRLAMDSGFITASTLGAGGAGTIAVRAGSVSLVGGAQIASSTIASATNQAGSIAINADSLSISGRASAGTSGTVTFPPDLSSGVFSISSGVGKAGSINITTPSLTLADSGKVTVTTSGSGDAGTIVANVGTANITGGARFDSSTKTSGRGGDVTVNGSVSISGAGSGLFSTTSSTGEAGKIVVTGPFLAVSAGGRIDSSTTAAGKGGAITVNAPVSVSDSGSGLFSTTSSAGDAGTITVNAPTTVASGGRIDSSTRGAGNGGAIVVNGMLSVRGAGSGLFSTASSATSATKKAGTITVNGATVTVSDAGTIDSSTAGAAAGGAIELNAASQAEISNGGSIRADSTGSGLTGNVTITAGERITMTDGSISTRALTSDGGNIVLKAPQVIRLEAAQITTSVQSGSGGGGNIMIDPQFLIANNSMITANAFGGPGGNITIVADNFLPSATTLIQASSALSTPGTIEIVSPENNLASSIAQLPRAFVDASRLLRGSCSARREGAPSSFMVAGRGGVPADADGYLPSFIGNASAAPLAFARLDYGDCAR